MQLSTIRSADRRQAMIVVISSNTAGPAREKAGVDTSIGGGGGLLLLLAPAKSKAALAA